MTIQPLNIYPFSTGLSTDIQPWLAPEDSFSVIDNAHIHHGFVEKRSGFETFGQLIPSSATVAITGITQALVGVVTAVAHGYSTDDKVVILDVTGMIEVNNKIFTIIVLTVNTFSIGIDTLGFTPYAGGGTTQIVDNLLDRVMGIWRYTDAQNVKATLAFTTTTAHLYNTGTFIFDKLTPFSIMDGDTFDYIVATEWQTPGLDNRLYFTNGKEFDSGSMLNGIRFYDSIANPAVTFDFNNNLLGGGRILFGGKLLFVVKQRLIVLNTFERDGANTVNFPQRARWCQAETPTVWDDLTPGQGGFVDCPTGDHIISAQAIQDIIIVFFTNSVWTLRYVPNPNLPFRWDKLNDFRSCDGKMASVNYDREIRALGVRGISACDGVSTRRIDQRIETFTIDEISAKDFQRVFCKRSFAHQRWWTLYPQIRTGQGENDPIENSAALIWDDVSSSYSTYTINMNCLGFGNSGRDYALSDFTAANGLDLAIIDFVADETLQSYFWQQDQEAFIGGNIFGTVFTMETSGTDDKDAIETNLITAAWNPFKQQGIECQFNYIDIFVDTNFTTLADIQFFKNNDDDPYLSQAINFLPNLDFVANVNQVTTTDPVQVTAPSHGLTTGDQIYIYLVLGTNQVNGVQFLITVVNENEFTLDGIDGTLYGIYSNGGQVVKREFYKTKTWKRAYAGGIGYQHKIRIINGGFNTPYRIHGFKPSFKAIGQRTID